MDEGEEAKNDPADEPSEFIEFGLTVDEHPSGSPTTTDAEKFRSGKSFRGHWSIVAHQVKMGILI
ncbi:MAG: hypothetical protein ACKO0N_02895 [Planctomycetota bacterium]